MNSIDHLVVAASDLASGRAWLEARLGVPLSPGGEHVRFGTHNLLLSLGDSYLELIAVNPQASPTAGPHWFGLDMPELQALLSARPRLIHWIAQVPDMVAAQASSPEAHGEALALSRGDLRWSLTVLPDGELPLGGVLPSLIQWEGPSPSKRLPDVGVRLERLELFTPKALRLTAALEALDLTESAEVEAAAAPALRATLRTPRGSVTLD